MLWNKSIQINAVKLSHWIWGFALTLKGMFGFVDAILNPILLNIFLIKLRFTFNYCWTLNILIKALFV